MQKTAVVKFLATFQQFGIIFTSTFGRNGLAWKNKR